MDKETYIITFNIADTADTADANLYAEELRQALLDALLMSKSLADVMILMHKISEVPLFLSWGHQRRLLLREL